MIEYDAVTTFGLGQMVKDVNERIKEGWKPLGGIAVSIETTGATDCHGFPRITETYTQAMIREESA